MGSRMGEEPRPVPESLTLRGVQEPGQQGLEITDWMMSSTGCKDTSWVRVGERIVNKYVGTLPAMLIIRLHFHCPAEHTPPASNQIISLCQSLAQLLLVMPDLKEKNFCESLVFNNFSFGITEGLEPIPACIRIFFIQKHTVPTAYWEPVVELTFLFCDWGIHQESKQQKHKYPHCECSIKRFVGNDSIKTSQSLR